MKLNFFIFLAVICAFVAIGDRALAACQSTVNVIVVNPDGQAVKGAKFAVYEQLSDVHGAAVAAKLLGASSTDKNTGFGVLNITLSEGVEKYAIKISNPSFDGYDYWYFNQLSLFCGQAAEFKPVLSAVKVKVNNYQGILQKNIKYTVFSQGHDANNEPIILQQVGSGNTGPSGEQLIYLPEPLSVPNLKTAHYALEVKDSKGGKFYKYNISPSDGQLLTVNFRFSDLLIYAKDSKTGAFLPNIKLNMYERLAGEAGGYKIGKAITTIQTNEAGMAYFQHPAGQYVLQFTKSSGEKISFYDIAIRSEERMTYHLSLADYNQAKCAIRSTLSLRLRDFSGQNITNVNFNLYEQNLDNDGWPTVGAKIGGGRVDAVGLSKISIQPQPAKQYMLEICDQSKNFGCFWFQNINLDCSEDLTIFQDLKSVDIILRDNKGRLAVGQRFKIYAAQRNIDGQIVIDKNRLINSFVMPTGGAYRLYLDDRQPNGESLSYLLAVDIGGREVFTEFTMNDGRLTVAEYVIDGALKSYATPITSTTQVTGVMGKILLQVQANGEAWYVNPADGRRYFLNRPDDAFAIMRKLSVGISNADLAKIRVNVDYVSKNDIDSDGDGLPDALEQALSTNPFKTDTDGDGYSDYEEVKNGFNPLGLNNWQFNETFARRQAGRILLQVEGRGEAWYVNPNNLQRYYLGRPKDAFAVMQYLGLGISDTDLSKISEGSLF